MNKPDNFSLGMKSFRFKHLRDAQTKSILCI